LLIDQDILGDRRGVLARQALLEPRLGQALGDRLLALRELRRRRDVGVFSSKGFERERARLGTKGVEVVRPAADEDEVLEVGLERLDGEAEGFEIAIARHGSGSPLASAGPSTRRQMKAACSAPRAGSAETSSQHWMTSATG